MPPAPRRKRIPLAAKLEAVLLRLGFTREQIRLIEWDHNPPLAMRAIDPETGDFIPHQHDPEFLEPMLPEQHAEKTHGKKGVAGSGDISRISKAKRLAEQEEEFRRRLMAKREGEKPREEKRRESRPMPGSKASGWRRPMRKPPERRG